MNVKGYSHFNSLWLNELTAWLREKFYTPKLSREDEWDFQIACRVWRDRVGHWPTIADIDESAVQEIRHRNMKLIIYRCDSHDQSVGEIDGNRIFQNDYSTENAINLAEYLGIETEVITLQYDEYSERFA